MVAEQQISPVRNRDIYSGITGRDKETELQNALDKQDFNVLVRLIHEDKASPNDRFIGQLKVCMPQDQFLLLTQAIKEKAVLEGEEKGYPRSQREIDWEKQWKGYDPNAQEPQRKKLQIPALPKPNLKIPEIKFKVSEVSINVPKIDLRKFPAYFGHASVTWARNLNPLGRDRYWYAGAAFGAAETVLVNSFVPIPGNRYMRAGLNFALIQGANFVVYYRYEKYYQSAVEKLVEGEAQKNNWEEERKLLIKQHLLKEGVENHEKAKGRIRQFSLGVSAANTYVSAFTISGLSEHALDLAAGKAGFHPDKIWEGVSKFAWDKLHQSSGTVDTGLTNEAGLPHEEVGTAVKKVLSSKEYKDTSYDLFYGNKKVQTKSYEVARKAVAEAAKAAGLDQDGLSEAITQEIRKNINTEMDKIIASSYEETVQGTLSDGSPDITSAVEAGRSSYEQALQSEDSAQRLQSAAKGVLDKVRAAKQESLMAKSYGFVPSSGQEFLMVDGYNKVVLENATSMASKQAFVEETSKAVGAHSKELIKQAVGTARSSLDGQNISPAVLKQVEEDLQNSLNGAGNRVFAEAAQANYLDMGKAIEQGHQMFGQEAVNPDFQKSLAAQAKASLEQHLGLNKAASVTEVAARPTGLISEADLDKLQSVTFHEEIIQRGQTFSHLAAAHDLPLSWDFDDTRILVAHAIVNHDVLSEMHNNMIHAGLIPEGVPYPNIEDLVNLAKKANNGDHEALRKLQEALHYIPAGAKVKILDKAGIQNTTEFLNI